MFDIDKELNEIRNINVSPSKELIKSTKEMVEKRNAQLKDLSKQKKKSNIIKLTSFAALPAVAAILFAVVIGLALPKPAAQYSIDINPTMTMSVDENGYVLDIDYDKTDAFKGVNAETLQGTEIEYAISEIILSAHENGYINADENVLIGCFGEDQYNNISKNQIGEYLKDTLTEDITLMSVHGSKQDWDEAKQQKVSAGLYALSMMADNITINSNTTLDSLILDIEHAEGVDIELLLAEYAEPIEYKTPVLSYTIDEKYIIFNWAYIDYKAINYDGNITYQLVASDSYGTLLSNPQMLDTYTFAAWDKQPIDYTLLIDENLLNKYYGIITVYDDGTRVIDENAVFVPQP